jgi:AAA15 family ATPase/GTPase
MISKIKIKNFKSFEELSMDFNNFNVLIGACASGKSNFIEIFKLLKDISQDFENGISKHGGPYLQNFNLSSNDLPSFLKITFDNHLTISQFCTSKNDEFPILVDFNTVEYGLTFNFNEDTCEILNEIVKIDFELVDEANENRISKNALYLKNLDGNVTAEFERPEEHVDIEYFVPQSLLNLVNNTLKNDNLLMVNSALSTAPISWASLLKNLKFYNFDPKFCKTINKINGNNELSEFGDTLPIVLDKIIKNNEAKRKFLNLLTGTLPYINDVEIEQILDNQRLFAILESYSDVIIPSPLVSDGTGNIMALIIALYFEKSDTIFIEEPERNIHPALFIKIVEMMKEVSSNKQIVITTHSPEILKYCELNDIFLISRNKNGFSNISKPIDNDTVRPFIEELGIDEVFVDNYLGLGNE